MSETRELTAEERAVVERFEAGEAAPESWPGYEATEWRCGTCAQTAVPQPPAAELLDQHPRREIPAHVLAEWDRKYRRCHEHNRARYYCGCAHLPAAALTDGTPR